MKKNPPAAPSHPQPVTSCPGNAALQLLTDLLAFTPRRFPRPVAVPGPLVLQQLLGNSHGPQGRYFGVKADGKAPQPSPCWKPSGTWVAGEGWVSPGGTARASTARR